MKRNLISSLVFIAFLLSCNRLHKESASKDSMDISTESFDKKIQASDTADTVQTAMNDAMILNSPGQNPDWYKKIIKTASIKVEVADFDKYNLQIHQAAKQSGGYIAGEEQNKSEGNIESTVTIKVPADQFDNLMARLPQSVEKIIDKKITTEDVTGEVVDTKSRLQTKMQMRLKYLEFLKQAKNIDEVLKVQSEINDIQEEIESAGTRVNYLTHQAAFSTIQLNFYQKLPGFNIPDETPGFLSRVALSFKTGFDFISEIFIGVIAIWPLLLLIFCGVFIYKKRATLKNAKAKI